MRGARPGERRGGRQKGSKNKATIAQEAHVTAIVAQASADGITPLEVMLGCMREAWEAGNKTDAANYAKDAAPYIHPRLQAVEHSGNAENPVETVTRIELTSPNGHSPNRATAEAHPYLHRPS